MGDVQSSYAKYDPMEAETRGAIEASMARTPDFTEKLLRSALANWNQSPDAAMYADLKAVWSRVLSDLDPAACRAALQQLIIADGWLPRPIQIRKIVIDAREPRPTLDAATAWGMWVTYAAAVSRGSDPGAPLDPLIRATIDRLGAAARGMHTNGDRDLFITTFTKVNDEQDLVRYALA